MDAAYPVLLRLYADHICDITSADPGNESAWDDLDARGIAIALCTNKPPPSPPG